MAAYTRHGELILQCWQQLHPSRLSEALEIWKLEASLQWVSPSSQWYTTCRHLHLLVRNNFNGWGSRPICICWQWGSRVLITLSWSLLMPCSSLPVFLIWHSAQMRGLIEIAYSHNPACQILFGTDYMSTPWACLHPCEDEFAAGFIIPCLWCWWPDVSSFCQFASSEERPPISFLSGDLLSPKVDRLSSSASHMMPVYMRKHCYHIRQWQILQTHSRRCWLWPLLHDKGEYRFAQVILLKRLLATLTFSTFHHLQNPMIFSLALSLSCSDQEWHKGTGAQGSCGPCQLHLQRQKVNGQFLILFIARQFNKSILCNFLRQVKLCVWQNASQTDPHKAHHFHLLHGGTSKAVPWKGPQD